MGPSAHSTPAGLPKRQGKRNESREGAFLRVSLASRGILILLSCYYLLKWSCALLWLELIVVPWCVSVALGLSGVQTLARCISCAVNCRTNRTDTRDDVLHLLTNFIKQLRAVVVKGRA